jgi:hypothetical protein
MTANFSDQTTERSSLNIIGALSRNAFRKSGEFGGTLRNESIPSEALKRERVTTK